MLLSVILDLRSLSRSVSLEKSFKLGLICSTKPRVLPAQSWTGNALPCWLCHRAFCFSSHYARLHFLSTGFWDEPKLAKPIPPDLWHPSICCAALSVRLILLLLYNWCDCWQSWRHASQSNSRSHYLWGQTFTGAFTQLQNYVADFTDVLNNLYKEKDINDIFFLLQKILYVWLELMFSFSAFIKITLHTLKSIMTLNRSFKIAFIQFVCPENIESRWQASKLYWKKLYRNF